MKQGFVKIVYSLLHAALLLIVTYLLWNVHSDWTDSGKWLQRIQLVRTAVTEEDTLPDDLVLVNTCYDHVMVPTYDELGMECGQIDITDRSKLLTLFEYLKKTDDYSYIVCDIDFNREIESADDAQFFSVLKNMPRCVIPRASDGSQLPVELEKISAVSEYQTNILNNNFLKYNYLSTAGESIALRMAREMHDISIEKCGPLYFIDGKICVNSHILDIVTNVKSEYQLDGDGSISIGRKNILQLGTDVMPMLSADIEGLFSNKIVMIGDCFREDMHSTVTGSVSGLMIIYNAYHSIVSRNNVVPTMVWISLFLIYTVLTLFILYHLDLHSLLSKSRISRYPLLCIAFEWIGLNFLFTLVGLLSYLCANTYIDAWFCATYFTVVEKAWSLLKSGNSHFRSVK